MNAIESYILDPHKFGVYHTAISTDYRDLKNLFKEIDAFDKREKLRHYQSYQLLEYEDRDFERGRFFMINTVTDDFARALTHLEIWEPDKGVLSGKIYELNPMITTKAIAARDDSSSFRHRTYLSMNLGSCLEPNIAIPKTMDALRVKPSFVYPNFTWDIYSIRQNGSQEFERLFKSIPVIGEKIDVKQRGNRHSSRCCYEPFPAAVMLWANTIVDRIIPEDILNYFNGSVRYWEKDEWRISVILSAIAVESLLAEIYEEYFHELAPSDPLGTLRDKIEKKERFPPKARKNIDLVNQSRISAVHRGSMRVGEKEARDALIGATRFTQWTYSESPLAR